MTTNDMPVPIRILLVEDDEHDRLAFRRTFEKSNAEYEITECVRAEEAFERVRARGSFFDVLIIDHALPGMSGLDLCKELGKDPHHPPLLILTGRGSEQLAVEALKSGADDYIIKDSGHGYLDLLPAVVHNVIRKHADRLSRLRAEEECRERAALLDLAHDAVVVCDMDDEIVFWNRGAEKTYGWTKEEALGKVTHELLQTVFAKPLPEIRADLLADQGWEGELLHVRRDGTTIVVESRWALQRDVDGNPVRILEINLDVTEGKEAEVALRRSTQKLAGILDAATDCIIMVDEGFTIVWGNEQAGTICGGDILGRKCYAAFHGEQDACDPCIVRDCFRDGKVHEFETQIIGPGGDLRTYWGTAGVAARDEDGRPKLVVEFLRDVTERKQAEEALRKTEERYRAVVEDMPGMVCRFTPDGTLTFVSGAYCTYFNKTEAQLIGYNFFEFIPEEEREKAKDHLRSLSKETPTKTYSHQVIGADGSLHWHEWRDRALFDEYGNIVEYQSVGTDITEEKQSQEEKARLQRQLQQLQRIQAIGTLAGGIAHDFNNLLMAIQGNASLMLLSLDPAHPHYGKLKRIEDQVESGARLTAQLLAYARKGKYEVRTLDLNQIVGETSEVFGRAAKQITIHRELAEDLGAVEADQGQIEQALLNLYANAADAMPSGGDLILKTMNTAHTAMQDQVYDAKPGRYVLVSVTDTGTGMDKETQERIFDPFFTTKEMGRGTGLGLATVYGTVKGHGGYIDVQSEKGRGTTFSIYLPAAERKVRKAVGPSEPVLKAAGTILLADDEEIVRGVGQELLEALGYGVLTARDGREAIETFSKHHDEIDLVLLDMVMPNMGGGQAYDRLKEIDPEVKVLLSSGYSIDGEAGEILARGCNGFIQKPYSLKGLSEKIREILGKEF